MTSAPERQPAEPVDRPAESMTNRILPRRLRRLLARRTEAEDHSPAAEPQASDTPPLVAQILKSEGHADMAVVDLGREASEALRAQWSRSEPDKPFQSGGVMESAWLQTALGAGGTAASSLAAGNVFVATVNPATLMAIGQGVGSAVMGPGGQIVAQAPFVAAGSALLPVVAPVMLFTTISSLVIGRRLDRMQEGLGKLYGLVEEMKRFLEAEDYALFETVASQIESLRSDFTKQRRFAADAPSRLAMAERDVSKLRHKYRALMASRVGAATEARQVVSHLHRFHLATLYDLQVDALRLYWTLQKEPDFLAHRQARLQAKVERCVADFRKILDIDPVGDYHRKMKSEASRTKWPWRLLTRSALDADERRLRRIRSDSHAIRARIWSEIESFESAAEESQDTSIVFYRESAGKGALRVFHTRDLRVQPSAA